MISIIVPVYKVEPYLRQCVDSILNQTYRDIEVLLIDDGSPDRCGEICNEYAEKDDRIQVFHTENRGLSAARNLGLKEAKGDYIGFVDSDDWIEPNMYEVLLRSIEVTGADISECGVWYEYSSSRSELSFKEKVYSNAEILQALINETINNGVWNKLYCAEVLHGIEFPKRCYFEDIEFMQKVVQNIRRINTTDLIGYHYRQRAESITKTYNAASLLDYAEAHLSRYYFFEKYQSHLLHDKKERILQFCAIGVSKVWRWWYGCSSIEKEMYKEKIHKLQLFSREHFPLCGYPSWPSFLRLSVVFMRSQSRASFLLLFLLNQIYRRIWPDRPNGVE